MSSNEIPDQFDEVVMGSKSPFKHICYPHFHLGYLKSSGNPAKNTVYLPIISLVQKSRVAQWEKLGSFSATTCIDKIQGPFFFLCLFALV